MSSGDNVFQGENTYHSDGTREDALTETNADSFRELITGQEGGDQRVPQCWVCVGSRGQDWGLQIAMFRNI
jgi:hypothetical protein